MDKLIPFIYRSSPQALIELPLSVMDKMAKHLGTTTTISSSKRKVSKPMTPATRSNLTKKYRSSYLSAKFKCKEQVSRPMG
jgi:hypothetical protein